MELCVDTMLYSNMGNKNSYVGQITCSHRSQVPHSYSRLKPCVCRHNDSAVLMQCCCHHGCWNGKGRLPYILHAHNFI